ncbi:MAG: glycosyltransferase family 39 protein [Planctomycetaceae bacterium]|nr:glycosyltransferase family 39 protein [Planctomycetaceae bacterium]
MHPRWLVFGFWAALAVAGGLFVALGVEHVRYPGFLELMEADSLQQIARIAAGRPAYPMPDGEFIALAYTPLYYFASAPLYSLLGDSFAGPRLVSFVAALASGLLLFRMAKRETGHAHLGALAAALFFAGYRIMDAWLTCALPDSLFLLMLLCGFWFLAYGTRGWHEAAWLLFFTLAFWTKQHGAFFFGFAVLYALFFRQNLWPRWTFLAGIVVGGPVLYFTLARWLGEGFVQQTLVVPGNWERSAFHSIKRTAFVLAEFLPFALLSSAVYLRTAFQRKPLRVAAPAWMMATALLATAATMTVAGSSNNHYIPFVALTCLTATLGINDLLKADVSPRLQWFLGLGLAGIQLVSSAVTYVALQLFPHHPVPAFVPEVAAMALISFAVLAAFRGSNGDTPEGTPAAPPRSGWGIAIVLILVAAQFATSQFRWKQQVADPTFASGLHRLRDELKNLDGPVVWLPYGRIPTELSGMTLETFPSTVALEDIVRQRNVQGTTAEQLAPFFDHVLSHDRLYVLSDERIEDTVVWNEVPVKWTLVRDCGRDYSSVRQITQHWFGGGSFPRYLYRMNPSPGVTYRSLSAR